MSGRRESDGRRLTVGSLAGTNPEQEAPTGETEGTDWVLRLGRVLRGPRGPQFDGRRTERLDYNNPFGQSVERVWFDGRIVYAVELGEVEVDLMRVKVAQEYQIVYGVELDEQGRLRDGQEPERVPGQYNIYDSVPGMAKYSPLWQFNFVIVPRSYAANTLRSEADCLQSGYPILKSTVVEN